MRRFAWLQYRTQTLTTVALLAAVAVAAAITGIQLAHLYNNLVAHCHTGCDLAASQFLTHDHFMDHALDILAQLVPALFGVFWGAPLLARELETGTYRLAWTQSVSRTRWLVTKLVVVGLITITIAGLLSLTITWWYSHFHGLTSNQYDVFDRRDIVPIGYAVFAFALGALAGVIIRRTVPAMAATLGGYVFARIATTFWVRPHLLSPLHKTLSLSGAGPDSAAQLGIASSNGSAVHLIAKGAGPPDLWTVSSQIVTNNGHVASQGQLAGFVHQYCPNVGLGAGPSGGGVPVPQPGGPGADAGRACLQHAAQTFRLLITYQPASRYWTFQWLETGIFLALALFCAVGCFWWITRRAS
jgi:hypothetical protein